jgi:hypothetical protein
MPLGRPGLAVLQIAAVDTKKKGRISGLLICYQSVEKCNTIWHL